VENAVKHGIGNRTGRGTVFIRARLDGGDPQVPDASLEQYDLLIEIEDRSEGPRRESVTLSGVRAEDEDARPGAGIALKTLRQRLAHLHGRRAELLLTPTEHGMVASVRLPASTEHAPSSHEAAQ